MNALDLSAADPAKADPVRDAPTRGLSVLKQLGPGLIIAGSIVGSGELIATTKTGAQAGITLLWLIILGCVVKVFVQVEMGRHTITHGQTALEALNQIPGKVYSINWIVWFWFAMMIASAVQLGGIVGGVGQSAAIAMPITGDYRHAIALPSGKEIAWMIQWEHAAHVNDPEFQKRSPAEQQRILSGGQFLKERLEKLGTRGADAVQTIRTGGKLKDPYTYDDKIWALFATIITSILLFHGRYSLIQNVTTVLVVTFTFVTIGNFVSLQFTQQWSISGAEILRGLSFGLPSGLGETRPLATALATFGIIGVGASELVAYPYWCLEKGYALHTGPRDDSEAWIKRARGWMRVMHIDVLLSMIVYTVATVAFYLVGVAVLYRFGRDPEGMRMTSTLAEAYVPVFGEYARWMFLIGAIAVLYSTFLVATASHTRLYTDFFKLLGWLPRNNPRLHWKSISLLGIFLPILCLVIFCSDVKPDVAVLLSGIMQATLLPMLGVGALFFRYRQCDPRLRPSLWFDFFLVLSCISFLITGLWGLYENLKPVYDFLVSR
ncbi:MAG: Nramp family divalent metal transporter [Planctomycetaceae bacterium]|nr:Nramp family divalent metal transporter [Planctomycetaceae bacterium]